MRRSPSLTAVRAELRPWWRTRPLRSIALGWSLAILITVLLLLVPTPFPIWGYLVFPIAWVSDDISSTRVLATLVFDVLTLLGVIAALVGSPWISAGSRRPAPGSRAGAGELLLAAWARSLAAWTPVAPLLIAATALGGATWSALILLLIFLTALTGAWCGIGLGAAALVRGGAAARASCTARPARICGRRSPSPSTTPGSALATGRGRARGPRPCGPSAWARRSPWAAPDSRSQPGADAGARTAPVPLARKEGRRTPDGRGRRRRTVGAAAGR